MFNKYTAVPISVGLTIIAMSTASAVKNKKVDHLFGSDKFALCDLSGQNCTPIKTVEQIPVKLSPPLGLAMASNEKEIACLAKNIREESLPNYTDMVYVGWGTINGVLSQHRDFKKFKTICDYVYSGRMSWVRVVAKKKRGYSDKHYQIARNILLGQIPNPAPDCAFTNWDNLKLDAQNTFNKKIKKLPSSCSVKPEGSLHVYIGYR